MTCILFTVTADATSIPLTGSSENDIDEGIIFFFFLKNDTVEKYVTHKTKPTREFDA